MRIPSISDRLQLHHPDRAAIQRDPHDRCSQPPRFPEGLRIRGGRRPGRAARAADKPIRVVCWDEQQQEQKEAYDSFIGELLARYLNSKPGFTAKTVTPNDPEQGLSADVLDNCDVLMWWGHKRHGEIKPETGKKLVERIKAGDFSLIALHSAHYSTPFMEAMFERTRIDMARQFPGGDKQKVEITYVEPPNYRAQPKRDQIVTPYAEVRKFPDGTTKATSAPAVLLLPRVARRR